MPFKRGQSGNPQGGRMHAVAKANRAAALSRYAWDHYDDVLTGRVEATVAEKTIVARDVLDRHLGKPKISAELKVEHSSTAHLQGMAQLLVELQDRLGPAKQENANEIIDITANQEKQHISHNLVEQSVSEPSASQGVGDDRPLDPPGGQGTPGGGL